MEYPYLSTPKQFITSLTAFGGYNPREHIGQGEWYQMENLSASRFPLASPRAPRGQVVPLFKTGGTLFAKELLWVEQNGNLVGMNPQNGQVAHTFAGAFSMSPQLVGFGTYLVDMRGGKWFSTLTNETGEYQRGEFAYTISPKSKDFSVYLCDEQGEFFMINHFGVSSPEECVGGMLWLDTTDTPATLKRYYEDSATFVPIKTYLRITLNTDLSAVKEGDMVELTLPTLMDEQGKVQRMNDPTAPKKVIATGKNTQDSFYLVVEGSLSGCVGYSRFGETVTLTKGMDITQGLAISQGSITVKNPIPILDFVVECGNRLWGCRFGENRKGEWVNEIYASALGSFRVWEKFEGIADDSYTLSCGTDGPFTAAAVFGGNPLFFKEKYLHRVYGTFPFSVTPTPCNGVKQGFANTVCVVNNLLYYVSPGGLCVYNGASPKLLDFPLPHNLVTGAAGGTQTAYYLFLEQEQEERFLLVYHPLRGMFTKESTCAITQMASFNNRVYAATAQEEGRKVVCLTHSLETPDESEVEWSGVSGLFGVSQKGGRMPTALELSLTLPQGSQFSVQVQYDREEAFHTLVHLQGGNRGYFTLPLRLRQCHRFRLRISGKGDFTLHAIHQILREGGKQRCI